MVLLFLCTYRKTIARTARTCATEFVRRVTCRGISRSIKRPNFHHAFSGTDDPSKRFRYLFIFSERAGSRRFYFVVVTHVQIDKKLVLHGPPVRRIIVFCCCCYYYYYWWWWCARPIINGEIYAQYTAAMCIYISERLELEAGQVVRLPCVSRKPHVPRAYGSALGLGSGQERGDEKWTKTKFEVFRLFNDVTM